MPQRQECVAHFTLDPQWALGRGGDCTLGEHNQAGITDTVHRALCWLCLRVFQVPEFLKKSPQKSSPEDLIVKPGRRLLAAAHHHLWPQHPQHRTPPLHYRQRYCNSNFKSSRPPLGDWLPHPWAIWLPKGSWAIPTSCFQGNIKCHNRHLANSSPGASFT